MALLSIILAKYYLPYLKIIMLTTVRVFSPSNLGGGTIVNPVCRDRETPLP